MNLLLDTHTLIWWVLDDPRLSTRAGHLIDGHEAIIFVSAATAWELTTKHRAGKLREATMLTENLLDVIQRCKFRPLPITVVHGHRAGLLPGNHRDPFDRMLAAQAIIEDLGLVTVDPALAGLGARIVW
ncbi:MAG: type II toxin-antitoxin system VapC family toxin [Hyphomicrobiaceae bacterium]